MRTVWKQRLVYTLIPLLLVACVTFVMLRHLTGARRSAEARAQALLTQSLKRQTAQFSASIEEAFALMQAMESHLGQVDTPQWRTAMDAVLAATRLQTIGYVNGQTGLLRNNWGREVDVRDRAYYKAAMSGKRDISVITADSDGTLRIALALPVARDGEVSGFIFGSYRGDAFLSLFADDAFGSEGYAFVCDGQGNVIVADDSPNFLPASRRNVLAAFRKAAFAPGESADALTRSMRALSSGSVRYTLSGQGRIAVYAPLAVNDWMLFTVAPYDVVEREVQLATRDVVGLIVVIILLAAVGCVLTVLLERSARRRLMAEHERLLLSEKAARQSEERMRRSEEEYRIAYVQSGHMSYRYDINSGTTTRNPAISDGFDMPLTLENVPESLIEKGLVLPESVDDFRAFFAQLRAGQSPLSACVRLMNAQRGPRWYQKDATTVFSADGKPMYAIVSYADVTKQRENELAYQIWRQRVESLGVDEMRLSEHNLTRDVNDSEEGDLLSHIGVLPVTFDERARYIAEMALHPDDREKYVGLLSRDRLLGCYYRGETQHMLEVRMRDRTDVFRWRELSVQTVPYPDSGDVKAFLLYRDIDARKKRELAMRDRSERDDMTGALNRQALTARVTRALEAGGENAGHALLFIDIDRFKHINDTFGHAAGDRVLTEFTASVGALLQDGDLLGRVGGDEFMVFLRNVPFDAAVDKRARQICDVLRARSVDDNSVTVSVGVAVFPRDGRDFATLYQNADAALYSVKNSGRNAVAYYRADLPASGASVSAKKTMLIADDSDINRLQLEALFEDEFAILHARDGAEALDGMRSGARPDILLLDLVMPVTDGMQVLRAMQAEPEISGIPVVVVSGAEDAHEKVMEALALGAADFVPKPVDALLIRSRVQSALIKAESAQIQAQNSFLQLAARQEQRYRSVLDATGTMVFEFDVINRVYLYDALVNRYLSGRYDARLLSKIWTEDGVASPADVSRLTALYDDMTRDPSLSSGRIELLLRAAGGEMRWFRVHVLRTRDDYHVTRRLLMTINDIHEEKLAALRLVRMAEYDELTGLQNRAFFLRKTGELLQSAEPSAYALVFFDVEKFRAFNDLYGFAAGDALLRLIADALRALSWGGTACRMSADYFAACVPNRALLEKRLMDMSRDVVARCGQPMEIMLTFGIYIIDDASLPVDVMLDRAAIAQKTVKGNYIKRCAYYDDALRMRMLDEKEIEGQMSAAIARQEFTVLLQPQVDHQSGLIVGAEALVRWQHPDKGLLTPDRFIGIFEKNGFITRLDYYVWERACAILKSLQEQGLALPLSVNLSRMDILDTRLCRTLPELTHRYGLSPELLRLEITESAYVQSPEQLVMVTSCLRGAGFVIEMDDFGSGYSSLNTLKDVPVDVLKLDMRFLSGGADAERSGAILRHIIDMGGSIGLEVVAEGVETRAQADALLSYGCRVMQGYYYARPMPPQALEERLRAQAGGERMKGKDAQ